MALEFLRDELDRLGDEGLLTTIRTISSPQGAHFVVDGRQVLNLCSNNYLGLANHPALIRAAKDAVDRLGVGPGAVRSIAGTMSLHVELEERLAAFKGAEATVSLQSGFTANLAVIPVLAGEGDLIFSDELNHASIIDGCRLSRARVFRYPHCDPAGLDSALVRESAQAPAARRLVITDGVFSMDGDLAPLPDIVAVARRHGAAVMVDDAHGEGVLGDHGRGIVHHFGLTGQVEVEVGTLSKAFGVMGGFIAGPRALIDFIRQRGRPFIFSSALTPADTAAAIAAVDLLDGDDSLVRQLWENTDYFKAGLRRLGFDTGRSQTPITPVMIGEAGKAQGFSRSLFARGVFAQAIGFPTVPRGMARIRAMISAVHSRQDLDSALEAFQEVGRELAVI
ncbi:MAG: glycine C-acetyltransferase [bacterium]|nr:glycine C-acetyltransferase [bacterium]